MFVVKQVGNSDYSVNGELSIKVHSSCFYLILLFIFSRCDVIHKISGCKSVSGNKRIQNQYSLRRLVPLKRLSKLQYND